jgi:hypothetical protein
MKNLFLFTFFSTLLFYPANGQYTGECKAELTNDTLTLETGSVFARYLWNGGNPIRISFGDMAEGKSIILPDSKPVFGGTGTAGSLNVEEIGETAIHPALLRAEVSCMLGDLQVLRVFRLVPGIFAIPCELYLKGKAEELTQPQVNQLEVRNIENEAAVKLGESDVQVIDRIRPEGPHWKAKAVEFFDVTDRNNTLVQGYSRLLYKAAHQLRGNLLFLENTLTGQRLFILKEAPSSNVQLYYPGYDFTIRQGELIAAGIGVASADLKDNEWTKAYNTVLGMSQTQDELGILTALRQYQMSVRLLKPGRDEMILMNTWGDRSQDRKVGEQFSIAELEAGARLGITHLQLDDGWQTGRSANSAFGGGSFAGIWRTGNYWKPNPERFPNGLGPVVDKGKQLGIEVCLWYNPSPDNSNANWEKDADQLIELYKEHGIRTFKIDGVNLPDKTAEVNFRKMLDKVVAATGGEAVFNLDVTASRRGGYHLFNEYGNLFLENRYTDFSSYYPFWTLRNLWMLSKYVPPQKLQIEFLNKWRNTQNYPNDPLSPANYSFDYLFAITMMAQPLAWFEGTGLPPEAFAVAPLIKKYREIQTDVHSGIILPIGSEPCGTGWTGFQSIKDESGYLLVFREKNQNPNALIETWLKEGTKIKCVPVLGSGKAFTVKAGYRGGIRFSLPDANSFALYRYTMD